MLRASQTCANHGSERVAGIGLSTTRMPKSVPKAGLTGVTPCRAPLFAPNLLFSAYIAEPLTFIFKVSPCPENSSLFILKELTVDQTPFINLAPASAPGGPVARQAATRPVQ